MIIKHVSINNKIHHPIANILQHFSVGDHSSWPSDYTQPRARLKLLAMSEFSSGWRRTLQMLNVVGRKWRPRSVSSLCITRWFTARNTSWTRANAHIYGLLYRIFDSCFLSSFLFLFLFYHMSFAHLRDLHKSRKREGGAKSKVQHRRPAGINREGRIPVPFTTASQENSIRETQRRSFHGGAVTRKSTVRRGVGAAWKMRFIANKIEAISDFISVVYIETMIRLRSCA